MADFDFNFDDFETRFNAGEQAPEPKTIDPEPTPVEKKVMFDGREIVESSGVFPFAEKWDAKRLEIEAAKEAIAKEEAEIKSLNDEVKRIRDEMQAKINVLTEKRSEIETRIFDARRHLRRLNAEVIDLERQLRMALDAEMAAKRFEEMGAEFDKKIVGTKWREFALQHQLDGAKYLAAAKRSILADKMGLGKTLTSLATLDMIDAKRVLVIAPSDVCSNFDNEIRHWAPHRTLLPMGKIPKAQRRYAISAARSMDEFTMTLNYEAWRRDTALLDDLISLRFDTVILDEAHSIKNSGTNAYKGVEQIIMAENCCPNCGGPVADKQLTDTEGWGYHALACGICEWNSHPRKSPIQIDREWGDMRSVKNVYPMTGTPILNRPQDLFTMLHLVDPVNFHTERDFLTSYCEQDFYSGKWKFRPGGMDAVVKRLQGKYIGRDRKSAGVVLPEQKVRIHEIEITPEDYPKQYKVIEQLTKHAQIILESGDKLAVLAQIALITRKRQANVWPGGIKIKDAKGDVVFSVADDVTESIKLDRLVRLEDGEWTGMIPEFTENGNMELGERVVVFSQFKDPLRELEKRLNNAGISVVRFDGDTPESLRQEVKLDFDRKYCEAEGYEPKWQVVLCNYRTGGVGLNFTAVTQTIVLDEEWNPGKNEQAWGRTDRVGQTEENFVHILRMPRTVDTWLAGLIDEKRDMIEGFEQTVDLQQQMLDAIKNGDMI